MARKQKITAEDIAKLSPKKLIVIFIAALIIYFTGGDLSFFDNGENNGNNLNNDFVQATVSRVVDGDTMSVIVGNEERRVRFLGVDTPETVHPNKPVQYYGKEASQFTKNSLTGKRVWLEYDKNPTDRYNRHLAYIWTSKPNQINENTMRENMFNAKLLLDGYAKVMMIKPNTKYKDLFEKFQDEAKNSKRGLWRNE
ncbi:MAG: thermonuclease family protein [Synergistaceae bacterium]|nr:thermonuclease family protein [Synergistaceae bacterium]MBQ6737692.1 thermonuclease family protein [Synergistaceae bacterium]MBR0080020.1 thermonuclease family protein [Synergistaceae bacterium]